MAKYCEKCTQIVELDSNGCCLRCGARVKAQSASPKRSAEAPQLTSKGDSGEQFKPWAVGQGSPTVVLWKPVPPTIVMIAAALNLILAIPSILSAISSVNAALNVESDEKIGILILFGLPLLVPVALAFLFLWTGKGSKRSYYFIAAVLCGLAIFLILRSEGLTLYGVIVLLISIVVAASFLASSRTRHYFGWIPATTRADHSGG